MKQKKPMKASLVELDDDDVIKVKREKEDKTDRRKVRTKKDKRELERRLQEEEEQALEKPKKKKKKAKVTAKEKRQQKEYVLALADQKPKQRISKINSKKLKSIMGESAEKIQQMLEVNDGDNARSLMYKTMLQSLVDLIPYAENNIRKTKGARGVYQLNSMISSVRELLVDVQASQDRGRIGELMVERLIAPAILDIGTKIVQKFELLKSDARDRMNSDDYRMFNEDLKKHRNELAEMINETFFNLREEIKNYMQR